MNFNRKKKKLKHIILYFILFSSYNREYAKRSSCPKGQSRQDKALFKRSEVNCLMLGTCKRAHKSGADSHPARFISHSAEKLEE